MISKCAQLGCLRNDASTKRRCGFNLLRLHHQPDRAQAAPGLGPLCPPLPHHRRRPRHGTRWAKASYGSCSESPHPPAPMRPANIRGPMGDACVAPTQRRPRRCRRQCDDAPTLRCHRRHGPVVACNTAPSGPMPRRVCRQRRAIIAGSMTARIAATHRASRHRVVPRITPHHAPMCPRPGRDHGTPCSIAGRRAPIRW